ncbi:MAG: hypothetical protein MJY43_02100 [Bacteroidales bacterium]|nr:hypothetical protein [Bacteroidales bacterium]
MKNLHCPLVTACLLLTGCTGALFKQYESPEPFLSAGDGKLELEADMLSGEPVADTLAIEANRSWSAVVVEGESWVEISPKEFRNLDNTLKIKDLIIKCEDNKQPRSRNALIRLSIDGKSTDVEIVQKASTPRLNILGPHSYDNVNPDGESLTVSVNSNRHWIASVEDGSTAYLSMDRKEGYGSAEITVSVAPNADFENSKSASVRFCCDECEDVVLTFLQSRGAPYFKLADGSDHVTLEPGRFNATIEIMSNTQWTGTIDEYDGFQSPVLATGSGTKEVDKMEFKFKPALCFGRDASMTVKVAVKDVKEPFVFTLTQTPVIRLMFRDPLTAALVSSDNWPLLHPSKSETPSNSSTAICADEDSVLEHFGGYLFNVHSYSGLWRVTDTGFNLGEAPGNYLTIPPVDGFRISAIYFECGVSGCVMTVMDASRSVVLEGGDTWTSSVKGDTTTWELPETKPSEGAALVLGTGTRMAMRDMIVYYDK